MLPAILHDYGAAKHEMATSLQGIAERGWIPLASAIVGTEELPPMWAGVSWKTFVPASSERRWVCHNLNLVDDFEGKIL